MSSIFDVIVLACTDFLQWYADEALSGADIFSFLIKQARQGAADPTHNRTR